MTVDPAPLVTRDAFVAAYGGVYENSPWVAARAWETADPNRARAEHITAALRRAVDEAPAAARRELLRAYPELTAAVTLSAESKKEHAAAGLDHCTPAQQKKFRDLNRAYRKKFNFPFIIAVRGKSAGEILQTFTKRLGNTQAAEEKTALMEAHKIAALRMAQGPA